jgi:hypothetical protein
LLFHSSFSLGNLRFSLFHLPFYWFLSFSFRCLFLCLFQ